MQIRTFEEKDAAHVKELVFSILHKEFPLSQRAFTIDDLDAISRAYGGPRDVFFVAEEDDGKIVGTAGVKEDTKTVALLRRIYVRPDCRRKGYGANLMERALEFCAHNGYHQLVFRSTDQMTEAISLCLKNGFVEKERLNLGNIQIVKFIRSL